MAHFIDLTVCVCPGDVQADVATAVLGDIVTAVINGSDGCVFCFGHAKLGKLLHFLSPTALNCYSLLPTVTNTLLTIPLTVSICYCLTNLTANFLISFQLFHTFN